MHACAHTRTHKQTDCILFLYPQLFEALLSLSETSPFHLLLLFFGRQLQLPAGQPPLAEHATTAPSDKLRQSACSVSNPKISHVLEVCPNPLVGIQPNSLWANVVSMFDISRPLRTATSCPFLHTLHKHITKNGRFRQLQLSSSPFWPPTPVHSSISC